MAVTPDSPGLRDISDRLSQRISVVLRVRAIAEATGIAVVVRKDRWGYSMNNTGEYLAFSVGREEYGIDILSVQEIRRYEAATKVAGAAHHMLGLLNLRGTIVPITDMRSLLLDQTHEVTSNTVTVFCNCNGSLRGIVVDSVNDVIRPADEDIKATSLLAGGSLKLINAIASMPDERSVLLTTVEQLLGVPREAANHSDLLAA